MLSTINNILICFQNPVTYLVLITKMKYIEMLEVQTRVFQVEE